MVRPTAGRSPLLGEPVTPGHPGGVGPGRLPRRDPGRISGAHRAGEPAAPGAPAPRRPAAGRGRRRHRPRSRSRRTPTAAPAPSHSATPSGSAWPRRSCTAGAAHPRRARQRPRPGRRGRDPRAPAGARASRVLCPATCWARSPGWRPGSASSTRAGWYGNSTPTVVRRRCPWPPATFPPRSRSSGRPRAYEPRPDDDGLVLDEARAVAAPDAVAAAPGRAGCPPTRLVVEDEDLRAYFLRTGRRRRCMRRRGAEAAKLRRSRLPWSPPSAFTLAALVGGLFMFIAQDPDRARSLGLVGAKAQLAGDADWPGYLALLAQAVAVGGLLIFGMVFIWIFGREFTDHTAQGPARPARPRASRSSPRSSPSPPHGACAAAWTGLLGLLRRRAPPARLVGRRRGPGRPDAGGGRR